MPKPSRSRKARSSRLAQPASCEVLRNRVSTTASTPAPRNNPTNSASGSWVKPIVYSAGKLLSFRQKPAIPDLDHGKGSALAADDLVEADLLIVIDNRATVGG